MKRRTIKQEEFNFFIFLIESLNKKELLVLKELIKEEIKKI
jgi:hypothetical protein